MKRIFLITGFSCLVLLTSLSSFAPVTDSLTNDILSYTNKFRKSKKMSELTMNEELNAIAKKHSEDMAKSKVGFGHGGFNKRFDLARKKVQGVTTFAENVAYGVDTGKEVVDMWKKSSGHRKNMLGRFKYIGIGTAKDRKGRIYYTQVFAN